MTLRGTIHSEWHVRRGPRRVEFRGAWLDGERVPDDRLEVDVARFRVVVLLRPRVEQLGLFGEVA